jgi:hypothetical protein
MDNLTPCLDKPAGHSRSKPGCIILCSCVFCTRVFPTCHAAFQAPTGLNATPISSLCRIYLGSNSVPARQLLDTHEPGWIIRELGLVTAFGAVLMLGSAVGVVLCFPLIGHHRWGILTVIVVRASPALQIPQCGWSSHGLHNDT